MTAEQLTHYLECLKNGCSEKLAEMLALGMPPMSNTDREFLEGRAGCYDQFSGNEKLGNYYRKVAESRGQNTTGKLYLSGLAAYPGDPEAWVSGKGDVKRVLEKRGWGADGAVSVPVKHKAEVTGGGIASDIVEREVERRLESNPEARVEDVREQAVSDLAPHWSKKVVD